MVAILITAGPTREYLDDVRYLSNGSSGRMGCALAQAALEAGHDVYLVLGPVERVPPTDAHVRSVVSAREMQEAAEEWFGRCDVAIAAAAVSDYRPVARSQGKPPRGGPLQLELVPNPDIVKGLAAVKEQRVVVGFALESAEASVAQAVARGRQKLVDKGLDLVVCNLADVIGKDETTVVLVDRDGGQVELVDQDKLAVARAVVGAAVRQWQQQKAS